MPRHLLGIDGLPAEDIKTILARAGSLPSEPPPRPRSVGINLFFEPSTRTRVSFEIAAKRLGLEVVNWTAQGSSHEKGETLLDTANNVAAMGPAAIVVRHPAAGAAAYLAKSLARPIAIINAGDGAHEHPSQALLDAFTLQERLGSLVGRTIAIVGDIAHSRVARSDVFCFTKLGAKVRLCGPPSFLPVGLEALGPAGTVSVHRELTSALPGVDAVIALRIQRERLDGVGLPGLADYVRQYGLTRERLEIHAKEAVVLHPGPINRGVELTSELADGPRSLILQQVENGVRVRMAIWQWVLEGAS